MRWHEVCSSKWKIHVPGALAAGIFAMVSKSAPDASLQLSKEASEMTMAEVDQLNLLSHRIDGLAVPSPAVQQAALSTLEIVTPQ